MRRESVWTLLSIALVCVVVSTALSQEAGSSRAPSGKSPAPPSSKAPNTATPATKAADASTSGTSVSKAPDQKPATSNKADASAKPSANLKDIKNPLPYTAASIAHGKAIYLHYCQECHDADGKSLANIVTPATNLTTPEIWKKGTSDGELFATISDGASAEMPPFKNAIKDEKDRWEVVNFLRSIGPKNLQPEIKKEDAP